MELDAGIISESQRIRTGLFRGRNSEPRYAAGPGRRESSLLGGQGLPYLTRRHEQEACVVRPRGEAQVARGFQS